MDCLRLLARREISANGRNYLFTCALEAARPGVNVTDGGIKRGQAATYSVPDLMSTLPVMLRPGATADETALFTFADTGDAIAVTVCGGVADVKEAPGPAEAAALTLQVRTTGPAWRKVASGQRTLWRAWLAGEVSASPGIWRLNSFLGNFELPK